MKPEWKHEVCPEGRPCPGVIVIEGKYRDGPRAGITETALGALALWLAGLPPKAEDPEVEHLRCDELLLSVLEALDPCLARELRERQNHYWYA